MNFPLILAIEFPKKKNYGCSKNLNLKYDRNFQLIVFLINALLFVSIEQKSKTEV